MVTDELGMTGRIAAASVFAVVVTSGCATLHIPFVGGQPDFGPRVELPPEAAQYGQFVRGQYALQNNDVPTAVAAFEVGFAFANLFEHGNIGLPLRLEQRLAGLVVTPALHRRHHANRRPELDSNFGTILTVWDRLLGTYGDSSSAVRFDTGLPNRIHVRTLGEALILPVASQRDGIAGI